MYVNNDVGQFMFKVECSFVKYNSLLFNMHRIPRNESAETLPKNNQMINLIIFYNHEEVFRVQIKSSETVGQLLQTLNNCLKKRFQNKIIGLCSLQDYFTLDYLLTNKSQKLTPLRNYQKLAIILQEIVNDTSTPTLSDFNFLVNLGQGISAAVYLVRHCSNGKLYALKQIKKQYFKQFRTLQSVLREKKILSQIIKGIPFTTKLEAAFESYKHLNFLLEFYPGGEFFYHLTLSKLSQNDAKICFAEIITAMEQLHSKKILYRDLKPENIMVDFDGHLHIGDFGLCRINLQKQDVVHSHAGSPQYMAYEIKQSYGYSYAADFYTMGAILYEMVKGVPPFYNTEQPPTFQNTSTSFRQLVLKLIKKQPGERLKSYNEIRKSKWLQGINWEKIKNYEYTMPNKLKVYENYIHEEFVMKQVCNEDLRYEEKYDKLLSSFYYLNPQGLKGIAKYYPDSFNGQKLQKKQKKDAQSRSNNSKSKSVKSKSSKHSNLQVQDNFKRRSIRQYQNTNIYTSPLHFRDRKPEKAENNKSLSKNGTTTKNSIPKSIPKDRTFFNPKNNQITFHKIKNVKSVTNLKAMPYRQQIQKSLSKKKKMY